MAAETELPLETHIRSCRALRQAQDELPIFDRQSRHHAQRVSTALDTNGSLAKTKSSNGFSLIELLVALAVFAIAALTLLRMEGASISRTADLDQRLLREVVAQNLAAEWLTDPTPPALGESAGSVVNAGRTFAYSRQVLAAGQPGVIRVVVAVREVTRGAPSQAFTLEFLRAGGV